MIKFYNSKIRKKEGFKPLKEGKIGMYVCGPTVYDVAHLGHGRSAVVFDVIRRYFEYKGYKVTFVSNYTDIDDKTINRAKERKISVKELVKEIIPEYEKDYEALRIKIPDIQPRATEHIKEMLYLIKKLEESGYTYILDDGVYFDISKFPNYGKLSGQKLKDLKMGARVEIKEGKRNPYDFVLWKFKKEGEPFWPSPWGDGRPGWHIECSAMSFKHLGVTFDIHGGGLDLLFPHHECEVAQSQAAFGKNTFAKYWIHNGFININNEKMSKSLGNFFTLKEIFKKYDPQIVRFMFLQTHYRNPIDFSIDLLDQAKASMARLHDFVRNLKCHPRPDQCHPRLDRGSSTSGISKKIKFSIAEARKSFEKFMDNDFDTTGAFGSIFEFVRTINILIAQKNLNKPDIKLIFDFLESIDKVLNVIFYEEEAIDSEVEFSIKEREEARKNKDFKKADKIRKDLLKKGIAVEDTSEGPIWKRI